MDIFLITGTWFDLYIYLVVTLYAIIVGRALALYRNRPDQWYLKRAMCPTCYSRKSLLHTPVSDTSFVTTCDACGDRWITLADDNPDVARIVMPIGKRNRIPPITFFWKPFSAVFRTELGEIEFDMHNFEMQPFRKARIPRELLASLYHHGAKPIREDYVDPRMSYERFIELLALPVIATEGPNDA